MKNYLLGALTIITIVLIIAIVWILNCKIYFDTCWENGKCQVDTRTVYQLLNE